MDNNSFHDRLVAAAIELGYSESRFRRLNVNEAEEVCSRVETAFGDAANGSMSGWWGSTRPCPIAHSSRLFAANDGWQHLIEIAPSVAAPVWFITENWFRSRPARCVIESEAGVVQAVLGNMPGFEYVVSSTTLDWLFAEDHESCVMVAGDDAVRKLELVTE